MSEKTSEQGQASDLEEEVVVLDAPEPEAPEPAPKRKPKFEGVEDEDGEYSAKVQKRISQLARQRREADARAEAALAREQAVLQQMQALSKDYFTNLDASIQRDMESAKAKHQRAFSESDAEGATSASAEMAELAARRAAVQQQRQSEPAKPQQQAPKVTPKTQEFIDENPWFNDDPEARGVAIVAHEAAIRRGMQAETPEYFDYVKGRVKKLFPEHFDEVEVDEEPLPRRNAPLAPVAAARRTVPGQQAARSTLPSLTKDEAEMARQMGISLKDYATQKAKINQGASK